MWMWGRVGGSGAVRRLEAGRQGSAAQPCGNRRQRAVAAPPGFAAPAGSAPLLLAVRLDYGCALGGVEEAGPALRLGRRHVAWTALQALQAVSGSCVALILQMVRGNGTFRGAPKAGPSFAQHSTRIAGRFGHLRACTAKIGAELPRNSPSHPSLAPHAAHRRRPRSRPRSQRPRAPWQLPCSSQM